jgi:hypothetical protein
MRLGIRPAVFLFRLLVVFVLTYFLWTPFAPAYTRLLAALTQGFLHLTELSRDPNMHAVTQMWVKGTAIFYVHRLFPGVHPPGIPAEWVQANLVLLIPLMLATPAASYRQRILRLCLALAIALALQVLDIAVTVKSFYASELGLYSQRTYSDTARWFYQFGDAFTQAMDTQLFPFVIWAGIHFRQLLERGPRKNTGAAVGVRPPAAPAAGRRSRREKRRAVGKKGRK